MGEPDGPRLGRVDRLDGKPLASTNPCPSRLGQAEGRSVGDCPWASGVVVERISEGPWAALPLAQSTGPATSEPSLR